MLNIAAHANSRSTTIGRSSKQVNVVLDVAPIKSISRRHAQVVVGTDGGGHTTFVLRDLVSAANLPCCTYLHRDGAVVAVKPWARGLTSLL